MLSPLWWRGAEQAMFQLWRTAYPSLWSQWRLGHCRNHISLAANTPKPSLLQIAVHLPRARSRILELYLEVRKCERAFQECRSLDESNIASCPLPTGSHQWRKCLSCIRQRCLRSSSFSWPWKNLSFCRIGASGIFDNRKWHSHHHHLHQLFQASWKQILSQP